MDKYLLIIPLLLIGLTPSIFAEIEYGQFTDKETIINNDIITTKLTIINYERIYDNGFKDFIFIDNQNNLQVETMAGTLTLDKNSCGFSFYDGGYIENNPDPLFTDSIIPFNKIVDSNDWDEINQISSASCETYWTGSELVAKRYASNVGFMEYKYILIDGVWKTQLEATNLTSLTDRVFGFDQTIDLNTDLISFGNVTRNLDNFDGQTFNRNFLVNNQGNILDFMNGFSFDFDLGFDNLDSITITDTGENSSKLTFHYTNNNDILNPNETLVIDPTILQDSTNENTGNVSGGNPTGQYFTGSATLQGSVINEFSFWMHKSGSIDGGSSITFGIYQESDDSLVTAYSTALSDPSTLDGTPTKYTFTGSHTLASGEVLGWTWSGSGGGTVLGNSQNTQVYDGVNSHTIESGSLVGLTGRDFRFEIVHDEAVPPSIPTPDAIDDLTLDSITQTTATVSFTAPNFNTGNLTNYMLNNTTPQVSPVTVFNQNGTDLFFLIEGLTLGTSYSAQASVFTEGGGNWTLPMSLVLNYTTLIYNPPGSPTLSATALSDSAIRFTSIPGTAGHNSTIWYGVQCELNNGGGWLNTVTNSSYVSFYEYTGLNFGDNLICQWRDGSVDGFSAWSNNATDILSLAVLSGQRTIADADDHLMQFINFVSLQGGAYFGLGALPFAVMLIGFLAGKKTVRIFTLATLFLMGMIHASGYYVYETWYWTLSLLFGIVLVMGRMKSD